MKIHLPLFSVCIFLINILFAQQPDWQWAKSCGGDSYEVNPNICVTSNSFVYMVGHSSSSSITIGSIVLTNSEIFIVKYNNNGNVVWAKSINSGWCNSITCDKDDNLLLTGYNNNNDVFVAKYDTTGTIIWSKTANGADTDEGNGISSDNNGNVLLTGSFRSTSITFDTITMYKTNLNSSETDAFIAKYNSQGALMWAVNAGGSYSASGNGVGADQNGNVCVAGDFNSPTLNFSGTILTGDAGMSRNVFAAKYNSSGNLQWAKSFGEQNMESAYFIACDLNNDIYLTGRYDGSSISFDAYTLTNSGYSKIFITKLDENGNVIWANGSGATQSAYQFGAHTDINGNTFITGAFITSSVNFGSQTLTNIGGNDIYLAHFDSAGQVLWAKNIVALDARGTDVALNLSDGTLYLSGEFKDSTLVIGNDTLVYNGGWGTDVFIAKTTPLTTADLYQVNHIGQTSQLFPNPSHTEIQITSSNDMTAINIYDLFGKNVLNYSPCSYPVSINIAALSSGVYFVELKSEKNLDVKKLVID